MTRLALALLLLVLVASIAGAQETLEPAALIGEWKGWWEGVGAKDTMYLTIKDVKDGAVKAIAFLTVRGTSNLSYYNRNFDCSGLLEGNKVTCSAPSDGVTIIVTVSGRRMEGTLQGRIRTGLISLEKVK